MQWERTIALWALQSHLAGHCGGEGAEQAFGLSHQGSLYVLKLTRNKQFGN